MQSRILTSDIHLEGGPYLPRGGKNIRISPSKYDGITINSIIVSPQTLYPMSSLGARYLSVVDPISGKPVAEVVEHLLSACYAVGMNKLTIETPSMVPVIGSGIENIYSALLRQSKNTDPVKSPHKTSESATFSSKDGSCVLRIEPSETLDITIERRNDPEINTDAALTITDVYAYIENTIDARKARPIARLKNPLLHGLQKGISLFGGMGITRANYIFNTHSTDTDGLKGQMYSMFQEEGNEHLAHTLVADFFGELHTFFQHGILGKIILQGKNNHFTRMELLHELHKQIT